MLISYIKRARRIPIKTAAAMNPIHPVSRNAIAHKNRNTASMSKSTKNIAIR